MPTHARAATEHTAYCLRCKQTQPMYGVTVERTANQRDILKGRCTVCDTRMNRFLPNADGATTRA